MLAPLLDQPRQVVRKCADAFRRRLLRLSRPTASPSLVLGTTTDLLRGRSELVAENALLRHQLIVLARSAKRARLTRGDRPLLVLLASRVRAWRQALLIVRPESASITC